MRRFFLLAACVLLSVSIIVPCFGQSDPLPRFGIGLKMSSLGAGIEAATAVTHRSNVRLGFNVFDYSRDFTKDGIGYNGDLSLRSLELLYDQYLIGPLHVSPGLLLYNGNRGTASASVPGGQPFTLGGTTFYSSRANPVSGTGTLNLGTTAPMVLIGIGNLLPRSTRHFAVDFEAGVIFEGAPKSKLNLAGSTCDSTFTVCLPVAGNPVVQNQIQAEQNKINSDVDFLRYYPVVSIGFGYKF